MAASNTPLYDLIELSGVGSFTTYDSSPSGGGQILGVVDNATYTDTDPSNSATQIAELNETFTGNGGTLNIGGVEYNFTLAVPNSSSDFVTVTTGPLPGTNTDLSGDGGSSDIVFIQATPVGGGTTRYFAAIDDDVGDLGNILSFETRTLDFTPAGDDVLIDLDQNNDVGVVCFAEGTLISCDKGRIAVEDLRPGARLRTWDNSHRRLLWSGAHSVRLNGADDSNRPVRIPAGALGAGLPERDLCVSPQHRMLIASPIAERIFGAYEVLVPAKKLVGYAGIEPDVRAQELRYWHLLCQHHEVLLAEAAPAETLMLGDTAQEMLSPDQLGAIKRLGSQAYVPARPVISQRMQVKALLERHERNGKSLVEPRTVQQDQALEAQLAPSALPRIAPLMSPMSSVRACRGRTPLDQFSFQSPSGQKAWKAKANRTSCGTSAPDASRTRTVPTSRPFAILA